MALTDNTTAFPAGITVGAAWNKDLAYARGRALGAEARGKGVNIQLGPTVGPIGRKPRGGRNWEGFGVDPVLQAVGASNTIIGMQEEGVIATVKHFTAYEQEASRMDSIPHGLSRAYSGNLDDRTLHELYAWPFAEAIRAGVGAIMTSYNEINGSAASQNSKSINGILKDELGFQGLVMTDWLAHESGVASALSGLDMSMPGDGVIPLLGVSYWAYELSTAVLNGSVPVERLNDMVTRTVATWYQMGQDQDYPLPNFSSNTDDAEGLCYPGAVISPICVTNQYVNVQGDHAKIARNISREAVTMLKNDEKTLPLSSNSSLYVFGTDAQAQSNPNACQYRACDTGTMAVGWGSGTSNFPYLNDPITAIRNISPSVQYTNSDTFPSSISATPDDIAIVFITSDSGEATNTVEGNDGDRSASGLVPWHNGDQLVQDAAAAFSTVIVVVHTVGPIVVEPWINLTSVKSVLFAHLPGQEAGYSLTDILFGFYSPSGHLPYSIPVAESDYPSSVSIATATSGQVQDTYSERIYIDYRYLNAHNIIPRYPFGHCLSYTDFNFSSLTLTPITPLSTLPPPRSPKPPTIQSTYSTHIPNASEVAWPANFEAIDRYLYPYLDDPSSITVSADPYPYPVGYQTTPQPDPVAGGAAGGNPALWNVMFNISLTVTNTGDTYAGKSVAMVFVQYPGSSTSSNTSSNSSTSAPYPLTNTTSSSFSNSSTTSYDTPPIQLRDFAKTQTLAPGASETVTLSLTRKDLSVWDTALQNWVIPGLASATECACDEGGKQVKRTTTAAAGFVFWVGESSGSLGWACDVGTGVCGEGRARPVA